MANFIFDGEDEYKEPEKVCKISDVGYKQILQRISIDSVRKDVQDNPQTFELGDKLFRNGKNNDWIKHFNQNQSELIDETMYFKWAQYCNDIKYYQQIKKNMNLRCNKNYFYE